MPRPSGGGLAFAGASGVVRGLGGGGFTKWSAGIVHGTGRLAPGQEVAPSADAAGIAYQAAGEGIFFVPTTATFSSSTGWNPTIADSFNFAPPAKPDPLTTLSGSLLTQQELPTAEAGNPAEPLEPSSLGTIEPVNQGDLAMIRQGHSPAEVDLATSTEPDRPAKDDLATIGNGEPRAHDSSSSPDVNPAEHHDLASAAKSDAVAESVPVASLTEQESTRGDPTEWLAMDTLPGVIPADPATVVGKWTGLREP
jgi:hypothetical protein